MEYTNKAKESILREHSVNKIISVFDHWNYTNQNFNFEIWENATKLLSEITEFDGDLCDELLFSGFIEELRVHLLSLRQLVCVYDVDEEKRYVENNNIMIFKNVSKIILNIAKKRDDYCNNVRSNNTLIMILIETFIKVANHYVIFSSKIDDEEQLDLTMEAIAYILEAIIALFYVYEGSLASRIKFRLKLFNFIKLIIKLIATPNFPLVRINSLRIINFCVTKFENEIEYFIEHKLLSVLIKSWNSKELYTNVDGSFALEQELIMLIISNINETVNNEIFSNISQNNDILSMVCQALLNSTWNSKNIIISAFLFLNQILESGLQSIIQSVITYNKGKIMTCIAASMNCIFAEIQKNKVNKRDKQEIMALFKNLCLIVQDKVLPFIYIQIQIKKCKIISNLKKHKVIIKSTQSDEFIPNDTFLEKHNLIDISRYILYFVLIKESKQNKLPIFPY